MLSGKKILIGITGGIAAYKSAYLVRLLVKKGAEVRVVMTPSACNFVRPLTYAALSRHDVLTEFADEEERWNSHVELGLWADLMLFAPATANTLAKMAVGLCDNLLLGVFLSARCPVAVAPAMDLDMWKHAATQANLKKLEGRSTHIIPVEEGELASGLEGEGRMAEPEHIVEWVEQFLADQAEALPGATMLKGKRALVTAGPTQEAIDPVRFLSNASSGKMGIAIAEALARCGAAVTLVKGPVALNPKLESIEMVHINSTQDLQEACESLFPEMDIAVMAAAVSDFTPVEKAAQKIKKQDGEGTLTLELKKTKDILQTLGRQKKEGQVLVGFALETHDELENAKKKLHDKNCDLMVLNSLHEPGAGFGHDSNKITILDRTGNIHNFDLKSKQAVARDILQQIIQLIHD